MMYHVHKIDIKRQYFLIFFMLLFVNIIPLNAVAFDKVVFRIILKQYEVF